MGAGERRERRVWWGGSGRDGVAAAVVVVSSGSGSEGGSGGWVLAFCSGGMGARGSWLGDVVVVIFVLGL